MIDHLIAKNLIAKLIRSQALGNGIAEEDTRKRLQKLASETNDSKLKIEIYFTLRGFGKEKSQDTNKE